MTDKRVGSFGSWSSPLTADVVTAESISLGEPRLDRDDVYWIEGRPHEGGRNVVVVRHADGSIRDVTSAPLNVRSRVHEYGGGAYQVDHGVIYFVNCDDQQIYVLDAAGPPIKLTSGPKSRYADIHVDRLRKRLIAVREEAAQHGGEAINALVAIDLATGAESVIDQGFDFYASPALSPDCAKLAWLSWRHPFMPWMSTFLTLASLDDCGRLTDRKVIAGSETESVTQPQWSPDNVLYFVSDRTDFWNIYRWTGANAEAVLSRDAEFAAPQWMFALSTYAFVSPTRLVYAFTADGAWRFGTLDLHTLNFEDDPREFSSIAGLRANATMTVMRCSTPTSAPAISLVETATGALTPVKYAVPPEAYQQFRAYFSEPKAIRYPTDSGDTAYAYFYPPANPDWQAAASEKPPLLVKSHGGPTSAANSGLDLSIQFWTSRGFAVLNVNYRGSSGYGREYRNKLYGRWGVADVADCINGALYLADEGAVDRAKLAITGGSAGGYTTLCALAFHNVFSAGASYYGISDLVALAAETHKFESHYTDWLIEPYAPDSALYYKRSPIHFVNAMSAPAIFFHGEHDRVVPVDQAIAMHDALRAQDLATCLLVFEGEQHGFRRSENLRRALEAELMFYGMHLMGRPLYS